MKNAQTVAMAKVVSDLSNQLEGLKKEIEVLKLAGNNQHEKTNNK